MVVTLLDWYTANDELLTNATPFSCRPDTNQWQVSRNARNGILSATRVLPFRLWAIEISCKRAFDWQKIGRVTAEPHH